MSPLSKNLPGPAPSPRSGSPGSTTAGEGLQPRPGGRIARQRRPVWIAAGIGLVALAVVVNVSLVNSAGHRLSVVRVARDVAVGQQITRADVTTAQVAVDASVQVIPGRQLGEVVGHRAAVDLRAGALLTRLQLTTQLTPQQGQALVTVALKHNQLPPHGLAPGSQVRVVATPGGSNDTSGSDASPAQDAGSPQPTGPGGKPARDVPATVDSTDGPDADGSMTVALLVADADSDLVARQAAAGQIALVVTARRG